MENAPVRFLTRAERIREVRNDIDQARTKLAGLVNRDGRPLYDPGNKQLQQLATQINTGLLILNLIT